jgi:hypothetical protein
MSDPGARNPDMPSLVRLAATLTRFLAFYAAVMSVPICVVGSFVGPQILIPGIVHAVLAFVLYYSWKGLLHQRRWARWLLVVLSALGALALLIAIGQSSVAHTIDLVDAIFWLAVSLFFAVIAWALSTKSAGVWFTKCGKGVSAKSGDDMDEL